MLAEIRQALYTRLTTDTSVTDTVAEIDGVPYIFDFAPEGFTDDDSEYPRIHIGDYAATNFDSDDRIGAEVSVTLHAWSRYRGKKECAEILDACYDSLHRHTALSVTGYNVVDVRWNDTLEIFRDPDGLTHHGVIGFVVVVEKAA